MRIQRHLQYVERHDNVSCRNGMTAELRRDKRTMKLLDRLYWLRVTDIGIYRTHFVPKPLLIVL